MATKPVYTLKVEGVDELVAKLQYNELLSKPMRKAFSALGLRGKHAAQAAAPVRTGALRASITKRMSSKPVPTFVAVVVRATNKKGYSYPRLLEFSPRHHHMQWLGMAIAGMMSGAKTFLDDAAREIESKFGGKS